MPPQRLLHATIALFVPYGIQSATVADIFELFDYLMSLASSTPLLTYLLSSTDYFK
jgi:hypothetical protein